MNGRNAGKFAFLLHFVGRRNLHAIALRYAAIWLEGLPTRHSVMLGPTFSIGTGLEIHGGIQVLRGGEVDNNLGMIGLTLNF